MPFYVRWGMEQAEQQIDKMQENAFNTPGAEAPITPVVAMSGGLLLGGHLLLARWLGLRFWQAAGALLLGSAAGMTIYLFGFQKRG